MPRLLTVPVALTLVATTCLLFASGSNAWGERGHQVVASIAWEYLNDHAKSEVSKMLGAQGIDDVAAWPDSYDHSPAGRWSGPLHYANMVFGETQFDIEKNCEGNKVDACCIVAAVKTYQYQIAHGLNTDCKGNAYCPVTMLVHFYGDMHQPFHGIGDHMGYNKCPVTLLGNKMCGSKRFYGPCNMHSAWDSGMIELVVEQHSEASLRGGVQADGNVPYLRHILQTYGDEKEKFEAELEMTDVKTWFEETHRHATVMVSGADKKQSRFACDGTDDITDAMMKEWTPMIERLLFIAGIRLAHNLNALFSEEGKSLVDSAKMTLCDGHQ